MSMPPQEFSTIIHPKLRLDTMRSSDGVQDDPIFTSAARWVVVFIVVFVIWFLLRLVFFRGLVGSDDMYHFRFAVLWDHKPVNHWECRLLANVLIRLSTQLLGPTEHAAAIPAWIGSLVILISTLAWCYRWAGWHEALWAGLLIAFLPVDVDNASLITAAPIMNALLTAGTVLYLQADRSKFYRWGSATLLALGVIAHIAGIYYVAALVLSSALMAPKRFTRPLLTVMLLGLITLTIEIGVFYWVYDDAWLHFRLALSQAATENPLVSLSHNGRFNWEFIAWPIVKLFYSKEFALVLAGSWVLSICFWKRLNFQLRLLFISSMVYWLWMNYGSQTPWSYKPFWRLVKFWQPLTFSTVLLWVMALSGVRRKRLANFAGLAVLCLCFINLAGSGSWGQNVEISKELCAYAMAHPEQQFVTDYHTMNEIYVSHGLQTPANVHTTDDIAQGRLLDPQAVRVSADNLKKHDGILVNPLNASRGLQFDLFCKQAAGELLYATRPQLRLICDWIPFLRNKPWAVRKPPAKVYRLTLEESERTIPSGSDE